MVTFVASGHECQRSPVGAPRIYYPSARNIASLASKLSLNWKIDLWDYRSLRLKLQISHLKALKTRDLLVMYG